MGKAKPLKINIPNPCSENWDTMTPNGNGRFCTNCSKVIVDFSNLSGQELLRFFANNQSTTCGRFHNDQLNKPILPLKHKTPLLKSFYKAAAAFLALVTMKYSGAAPNKKENNITIHPASAKDQLHFYPEKITITGNVKDAYGNALENAEVKFGESIIVKTDKNGNFELEIPDNKEIKSSILTISYPNLVTVVRNYHPAMLSTSYTIVLYGSYELPDTDQFTMGVMYDDTHEFSTVISFTKNDILSKDSKDSLAAIANIMRNHPTLRVNIVGYPSKITRDAVIKKQTAIRRYFSYEEGISEERFFFILEKYSAEKRNIIEIKNRPSDYQ